ncbi:hypothetical protein GGI43DRAFT_383394 [Trichoderma evansii]
MLTPRTCLIHSGVWDHSTRQVPVLSFIEKYCNKVDSLEITGPFHHWYAQSCNFYNTNGIVYHGGDNTWNWMKDLFGQVIALHHEVTSVRLFDATEMDLGAERAAQWVILEAHTAFTTKGQLSSYGPIVVPRSLMFLIGKSEVEGQGTDGWQILQAKVWWDSGELERQLKERSKVNN